MPPLPVLSREQSRDIDRRAIEEYGFTGLVLMENAGRGCVDVLEHLGINGPVAILCGKGNNAGDGFVIARHLAIRGHDCRVLLLTSAEELRGDAATNFAILQETSVPIVHVGESLRLQIRRGEDSQDRVSARRDHVAAELTAETANATWLIDALLGTGAIGEPRPPFDTAIDWMNARAANTRVLAVDLPSGLDCDTGEPAVHTVRADHTCTFATMKIGFTKSAAKPFTGMIHICDIGLPPDLINE